jgi:hypothetical protein
MAQEREPVIKQTNPKDSPSRLIRATALSVLLSGSTLIGCQPSLGSRPKITATPTSSSLCPQKNVELSNGLNTFPPDYKPDQEYISRKPIERNHLLSGCSTLVLPNGTAHPESGYFSVEFYNTFFPFNSYYADSFANISDFYLAFQAKKVNGNNLELTATVCKSPNTQVRTWHPNFDPIGDVYFQIHWSGCNPELQNPDNQNRNLPNSPLPSKLPPSKDV